MLRGRPQVKQTFLLSFNFSSNKMIDFIFSPFFIASIQQAEQVGNAASGKAPLASPLRL
jgi:hypothetical protein